MLSICSKEPLVYLEEMEILEIQDVMADQETLVFLETLDVMGALVPQVS